MKSQRPSDPTLRRSMIASALQLWRGDLNLPEDTLRAVNFIERNIVLASTEKATLLYIENWVRVIRAAMGKVDANAR